MRFTEINLFGVYVAPISLMLVAAWIVTIALRRVAARFGLLRHVWHPALFVFATYLIVLSSMVLLLGTEGGQPKVEIRKSEKL
jgi:protein AaeX